MDFFNRIKNAKWIALAGLLAAVILGAVLIVENQPTVKTPDGGIRLDDQLDTAAMERYVVDDANVLSEETEWTIAVYNANWTKLAGRVMAVVTTQSAETAEETAWEWVAKLGLGENDALLLVETRNGGRCIVVSQGTFRADFDSQPSGFVDSLTYHTMKNKDFDTAVMNVFNRSHLFLNDYHEAVAESGLKMGLIAAVVVGLAAAFVIVQRILDYRRNVRDGSSEDGAGKALNRGSRKMQGNRVGSFHRQQGGYNGGFGSSHSKFGGGSNGGFAGKK